MVFTKNYSQIPRKLKNLIRSLTIKYKEKRGRMKRYFAPIIVVVLLIFVSLSLSSLVTQERVFGQNPQENPTTVSVLETEPSDETGLADNYAQALGLVNPSSYENTKIPATPINSASPITTTPVAVTPTSEENVTYLLNSGENFLSGAGIKTASEAHTASFAPLVEVVLSSVNGGNERGIPLYTEFASLDTEIPQTTGIGNPCITGESSWLTGYDWLSHTYHTAVDIACPVKMDRGPDNPWFMVAAPTRCVVWATVFDETEANKINGSGTTVLCKAGLSQEYGMEGNIIFGFSHLDNSIYVKPGQVLERGEPLGEISYYGTTGKTTGIHIHYTVIWEHSDGSLEFLNPNDWGAIGQ